MLHFEALFPTKGKYMKTSCVACDLDFCLSHFGQNILADFVDLFLFTGVERQIIADIETEAERHRFTFESFFRIFTERTGIALDAEKLLPQCRDWLENYLQLYPESREWFDSRVSSHIPVVIVTYGDPEFQGAKLQMLRLRPAMTFYTMRTGEKHLVLRRLVQRYGPGVLFVDDNPLEHDNVRDAGFSSEEVRTVRVLRPDTPYRDRPAKHQHEEVQVLSDIHF